MPFSVGRLTSTNSVWNERVITAYDPMGRVVSDQQFTVHTDSPWTAQGYVFSYSYNLDGTLDSITYPSGKTVDYTYDSIGRPYGASENGGNSYVNSTDYNNQGLPDDMQLGNLLTVQNCYNSRLQPIAKRLGSGTATDCAHQTADTLHLAYGFGASADNNGNLLSQTITADASYSWTQYYAYDGVNRLSMASENAAITGSTCPGGATWCRQYGYDHFGNRWIAASLDTLHMATPTAASAIDPATNRLASGTYDAAGNMTAYPFLTDGGSMAYDANNKMTSFTKTGVSVSTKYDAAGRRVRKVLNGETTVWVYDAFGRLAAEYTTEAQTTPADVYYRTTDHLGSTRIVTDSTGAVKQRRDFFPFGENIPADSSHGGRNGVLDGGAATYNASLSVRQQFTGQQRDEETGLDYFWERCFCAQLARFFSVDPGHAGASSADPSSWNAYTYVLNRPLRLNDPDGRDPRDPFLYDRYGFPIADPDPYENPDAGWYPLWEWTLPLAFNVTPQTPRTDIKVNPLWRDHGFALAAQHLAAILSLFDSDGGVGADEPWKLQVVRDCFTGKPGVSGGSVERQLTYRLVDGEGRAIAGAIVEEQNYVTSGSLRSGFGVWKTNDTGMFTDTFGGMIPASGTTGQYQTFSTIVSGFDRRKIGVDVPGKGFFGSNRILMNNMGVTINGDHYGGLDNEVRLNPDGNWDDCSLYLPFR